MVSNPWRQGILDQSWIAPTLQNGWSNFGSGVEAAGYRKTSFNEVELRGVIAGGTTSNGTVLFNLPARYRPAALRRFVVVQGNDAAARVNVTSGGDVQIIGVTSNTYLSLESVRFDVGPDW